MKGVLMSQPGSDRMVKGPGDGFELTDMGNAARLIHRHGKDLRFCQSWNSWLCWDGRRWATDGIGVVVEKAKDTMLALLRTAEEMRADRSTTDDWITFAKRSQSHARIHAALELAKSEFGGGGYAGGV